MSESELTAELAILNSDSNEDASLSTTVAGENSSEPQAEGSSSEPQAEPTESPTSPTTAPQPDEDMRWLQPLLNDPQFGTKIKAITDAASAFKKFAPNGDTAGLQEVVVRGQEAIREHFQFSSPDPDVKLMLAESLWRDNHEAFCEMLQVSMDLVRSEAPEEFDHIIAQEIGKALPGVWPVFEAMHADIKAGRSQQALARLDQLAGGFVKFGLSPHGIVPEAVLASPEMATFRGATHEVLQEFLDRQIGDRLPKLSDGESARAVREVHARIQDALRKDQGLALRVQNLLRDGLAEKAGVAIVNLLASRAQRLLPLALKQVAHAHGFTLVSPKAKAAAGTPAATSNAEAPLGIEEARQMSDMSILRSGRPVSLKAAQAKRAPKLTRQEARTMTFADVVRDIREADLNG